MSVATILKYNASLFKRLPHSSEKLIIAFATSPSSFESNLSHVICSIALLNLAEKAADHTLKPASYLKNGWVLSSVPSLNLTVAIQYFIAMEDDQLLNRCPPPSRDQWRSMFFVAAL